MSLLIGVLRLRECDEWGWLHVETNLSSIKRKFHLMHPFKCGGARHCNNLHPFRHSVTYSITHLHSSQPIPLLPTGSSAVTQAVRQRRGQDNQSHRITPHTYILNTLTVLVLEYSFASTYRIFPNLCWLWCHGILSFLVAHHMSDVQRGKQAPPKPIAAT